MNTLLPAYVLQRALLAMTPLGTRIMVEPNPMTGGLQVCVYELVHDRKHEFHVEQLDLLLSLNEVLDKYSAKLRHPNEFAPSPAEPFDLDATG